MRYKILSFLLIFSMILTFSPTAYATNVSIPDDNLKSALYQITGVATSDPLTASDLAAITGSVDLSNKGITDIDGIQYLTGADSIDLSLNSIASVPREIEYLTSLESLDLSGNRITRLPSNIGGLTSLKSLDIRANRLDEIPSALTKLSLETFKCDYNFLDVSTGSSALSTINQISAQYKYYEDQLLPIQNLSAYSPQSGSIIIYWDAMEDITFDSGVVGHISRFSVLDSDYNYEGETGTGGTSYEITGLDTTTEYTFYISADYYVQGTKYSGSYTKLYESVTLKAVPENTATPEPSLTATPTATPVPETATPEPETATPVPQTDTPEPTASEQPTQEAVSNGGGGNVIFIIIIVLVVIFLVITLLIIMRAIGQRQSRNSRYRR